MKHDTAYLVFVLVVCAITVVGGIAWMVFQWHECREVMGFSFWYCVKHVF